METIIINKPTKNNKSLFFSLLKSFFNHIKEVLRMKRLAFLLGVLVSFQFLHSQTLVVGICNAKCPTGLTPAIATQKFICSERFCCDKPTWCLINERPVPQAPWAGASTYDSYYNATWISEGRLINAYLLNYCSYPCKCKCKMVCRQVMKWPYNSNITGMAINTPERLLYISDDMNYIYTFKIISLCNLKLLKRCRMSNIPNYRKITGLAYSCRKLPKLPYGSLFVVESKWPNSPLSTRIHIVQLDANYYATCQDLCFTLLPYCYGRDPLDSATGVTYDPCSSMLFITDGKKTTVLKWYWSYYCKYKTICCCMNYSPVIYYGLGLKRSCDCVPTCSTGGSFSWCSNTPKCGRCYPYPKCRTRPMLGNRNFALYFDWGPSPSGFHNHAWISIDFTNMCSPKTIGVNLCGAFCNMIYYPSWGGSVIYSVPTSHMGGSCTLTGEFKFPIPCDPDLCCSKFCLQWIILNYRYYNNHFDCCLTFSKYQSVKIGYP